MDTETGPIRCDSSLSMIKIQPVNEIGKQRHPFTSHKFTDPEIEELYQLHSANQKRTELFRCFLYAILFYCLAHIFTYTLWICNHTSGRSSTDFMSSLYDDSDTNGQDFSVGDPVAMQKDGYGGSLKNKLLLADKSHWPIHLSISDRRLISPKSESRRANRHVTHSDKSGSESRNKIDRKIEAQTEAIDAHDIGLLYENTLINGQHNLKTLDDATTEDGNWMEGSGQLSIINKKPRTLAEKVKGRESKGRGKRELRGRRLRGLSQLQTNQGLYFEDSDEPIDVFSKNSVYLCLMLVLLLFTGLITTLMLLPVKKIPRNAHIPVLLWSATILLSISINVESSIHPRIGLGWAILETFLIWVTLPMRIRAAFFYTFVLGSGYIILTSCRANNRFQIGRQLGTNIVLLIMTNLIGIVSFYLSDKKQRRAFIDTRQSLEVKLVIEEQAKEQERLLLSVLPEHLALKMRQDLGAAGDGQFKKIYMSRHENVSILYADIVGFTAISSTYSASELVKILNELFARFDRLAEKYNQIRIKILGDCYYCICGAPEERPDHGILCVHMGLSMVKAIKYVREKTKSCVDMRVGIHTGAILAGVLGQRQWQFDIYSRDVELANKMESSGQAGRVHVSETTLSFLNNEFEVEPAHGEKREEILRIAGIKTYFIVKPLVPFREMKSNIIAENGDLPMDDAITKDLPSDLMSTVAEDSNSQADETHATRKKSDLEAYRLRLKEELLSRDGYKDLSRQSQWITLKFREEEKETEFSKSKDPHAAIYSAICPCALVAVAVANFFAISFTLLGLLVLVVGVVILTLLSSFSACEDSPLKSRLMKLSGMLNSLCSYESELWVRRLVSVLAAIILVTANLVFMIPCLSSSGCVNVTLPSIDENDMEVKPPLALPNTDEQIVFQSNGCLFPVYLIAFATIFLISVTLLPYLGSWTKSFIILGVISAHIALLFVNPLKQVLNCSENLVNNNEDRLLPVGCYLAMFGIVVLADLFALNRRLEKSSRVLFLWKTEIEQQQDKATQLRQKNEALVYNILPQHVAFHFLGSRRRKHEELYSQSYSEVGILFASMPNFSDFYSEETVNNQGLECLRFLNEVISDFDAILEQPTFADHIIKIKTIGSTYMAASGLCPTKQAKPEDPIKIRWHHLALLVEFAFELKRALNGINEQSFNHFVLKMGINHGPITAGVIGARKPHYDIWGNSVNVASRMESTGRSGCIQVTQETYRILRLFGYVFEQRGLVNVKGKGMLMTYYLIKKGPEPPEEEQLKLIAELEENQIH